MRSYNFAVGNANAMGKRNTSYARPLFPVQSGKSEIPTVIVHNNKQNKSNKKNFKIRNEEINNQINQNDLKIPNINIHQNRSHNINNENNINNLNKTLYNDNSNNNKYKENLTKSENKYHFVNDYLNLVRCSYPYCNCGNCIQKKNREHSTSPNYYYQTNIKSNYRKEFDWKQTEKMQTLQNAKLSHLDRGFKEHIKPGLESIMRKDYKYSTNSNENFKGNYNNNDLIKSQNQNIYNNNNYNASLTENNTNNLNIKSQKNKDNNIQMHVPFLGRSSYDSQFPHWNTSVDRSKKDIKNYMENDVPFSGKSSYMETYGNFGDKYYKEKTKPITKRDNLEVGNGNLICYTSTGETYRPLDYKMAKDLNNTKSMWKNFPANLRSAPYSKDCFLSTYERAFMDNDLIVPNK